MIQKRCFLLNAMTANTLYTNHATTFLCHVTTSFVEPAFKNSNGRFTTLVILIVVTALNCHSSKTSKEDFKKSLPQSNQDRKSILKKDEIPSSQTFPNGLPQTHRCTNPVRWGLLKRKHQTFCNWNANNSNIG